MAGPEGFRKKSPSELRAQLRQAVAQLSGEQLAPKGEMKELLALSESEIKEKYPRRYEMYHSLLAGQVGDSNAWFGNSDKGASLGSLDISRMKKWLRALNNLDTYIAEHKTGDSVTLKNRQATVFEDMCDFIERGRGSGYVKLPTGTGKTVLFSEFVEALDLRTLIVVPTKLLVDQTEARLKQFAPELDVGIVRSGRKKDLSKQCTVITYASLTSKLVSGEIKSNDYDCLILDEAHVGLSDARKEAIWQFNNALRIGFTATPDYSATKGVKELLPTEIHRMSIKEAVLQEGLLSGFQCILAKTETDLSKIKVVGGERYDEKELEEAVNNLARNQAAVDLYKQMFSGEMVIAYCAGVQHATDLAEMFNEAGVTAAVVSGKTPEKERDEILQKYDAGEITVLCNSDILIAGFDQPKAAVCLNLRPTLSPVVAEQRGGRVLRVNDEDEEKVAFIVDFVDKGHNPKHYPILFAEVAEETALLRRGKLGRGKYKKLDVAIDGLNVETESGKVAEFVKGVKDDREAQQKKQYTIQTLQYAVRNAGILSTEQYRKVSSDYRWPHSNTLREMLDSAQMTYDDFFGRVKWDVSTLQKKVREAKIKSSEEYKAVSSAQGWPSIVTLAKMLLEANMTRPEFFERKKWDVESLQTEVKAAGIKNLNQYLKNSGKKGWPSHWPLKRLLDAAGINVEDFFGRVQWTAESLQAAVRNAGVKSIREYRERVSEKGWPHGGSLKPILDAARMSYDDFFDRNSWKIETLQKVVLEAGIKSTHQYNLASSEYGWPSAKVLKRMIETVGMSYDEFFGRN